METITMTKTQLEKIIKQFYSEGWNEGQDSYGSELARDGYLCGEVDNHLNEYLNDLNIEQEINDIIYEIENN